MMTPLSLGFSPCPNDTFIFCRLVQHSAAGGGLFAPPLLEDVETLNQWALQGRLAVTKLSFHAAARVLDHYCVLNSGAALGRGCGPLLIGRADRDIPGLAAARVAIPGKLTTAALLFRMFLPDCTELVEMRFDHIVESVARGLVDAGVIIHESRFTYRESGLVCLQDLGTWWEERTGLPIPLGCIGARRELGRQRLKEVEAAIRESLDWARRNPERCREYIRRYAQETEDRVIEEHIGLYVNDFSMDLGSEGRSAVHAFLEEGRAAGILPAWQQAPFCEDWKR